MIASHFTDLPSGTRRFLPERASRQRVHRWFARRLPLWQSNAAWIAGAAVLMALTLVLRGIV